MMKMTGNILYPTEDDIIQLRKSFRLMSSGHLSRGTLTYILDTVQDLYNEASMPEALAAKAAHILFGIISLHPFIDGNKRTAYGTTDIFLRLNGYFIKADPQEGQEFIVRIAGGQTNEAEVKRWIRQRLKKL